jgi:hypothetical protein
MHFQNVPISQHELTDLEMALEAGKNWCKQLSQTKSTAALSKTRYATLEAFQKDLKTYNDLLAEYTRLTKFALETAARKESSSLQIPNYEKLIMLSSKKQRNRVWLLFNSMHDISCRIQKDIEALSDARTALRTAQTTLSEARAEQDKIQQAERELSKRLQADLEKCRAQNPVIGDDLKGGDKKYCYPVRINDSGEVQTDCVDDSSKDTTVLHQVYHWHNLWRRR